MADTTAAAAATATNPVSGLNYVKSSTAKKSGTTNMDTNTFLKLLVAQMQYQDPLEPQSNTDFVAQLAMMSGLEQVQTMNGSLSTSKAMNYVGKQIYATVLNGDTGAEENYSGIVTGVVMKNGEAYAVVGKDAVCVDNITAVVDAPAKTDDKNTVASGTGTTGTETGTGTGTGASDTAGTAATGTGTGE